LIHYAFRKLLRLLGCFGHVASVPMTPKQAFEILLNIPEPRRTLILSDGATALRVPELLALIWMDLDFEGLVM